MFTENFEYERVLVLFETQIQTWLQPLDFRGRLKDTEMDMDDIRFSDIAWGSTFTLAIMRLASASLVAIMFMVLSDPGAMSAATIVQVPLYTGGFVLFAVVSAYLDMQGVDWIGFGALLGFLPLSVIHSYGGLTKSNPDYCPLKLWISEPNSAFRY